MKDMTHSEPDSAKPAGELSGGKRSPGHDPRRNYSLDLWKEVRFSDLRPRAEKKGERAQMPWLERRGGWGQKGWKGGRNKQGYPSETERCSWPEGPKSRPTGVRASIVATKRSNA